MSKTEDIILEIKEIIQETKDTITIVFNNEDLKYKSGQYLLLKIPFNGKIHPRAYSLSSSPHIDDFPAITIKRVKNGKISNYLNDKVKINNKILSNIPKGNFTTEYDINNKRHIVCIAAGSGITPLISIIKSFLIKEPQSKITLFYVNRNENTIIFKEFLEKLENKYKNKFDIIHILTQPSMQWKGIKGRPSAYVFEQMLSNNINSEYFLCGPNEMMDNIKKVLKKIGLKEENINWESFGDTDKKNSNKILANFKESKVKISFEDDKYEINVAPDQTILEAALDEDIDLPFACSNGTCNVCQAICKKGKIEMENEEGLTEEEIKQNYILTCVSKPKSAEIEIEIPDV